MADYLRKVGASQEAFTATLTDKNGPVDLPIGATVDFVARLPGGAAEKVNAAGTIVKPGAAVGDPDRGAVSYQPVGPDLDTEGIYDVQWVVTRPGGVADPFPSDRNLTLVVLPNP